MEEQYVNFETAKMLKEAGFDVPCDAIFTENGAEIIEFGRANYNGLYPDMVSRPTQALAARWLREKHKLQVYSSYSIYHKMWFYVVISISNDYDTITGDIKYANYEDALEAGLQEAIKMIKR